MMCLMQRYTLGLLNCKSTVGKTDPELEVSQIFEMHSKKKLETCLNAKLVVFRKLGWL